MSGGFLADLHVHTTASDGVFTPEQTVAHALEKGLSCIAVTDHDTLDGAERAAAAAEGTDLYVIPGIEISVEYPTELHILGYFVDLGNAAFRSALETLRTARTSRAERILGKLRELDCPLTMEDVLAFAHGESVARPHIARAMIRKGYAGSVGEAFEKYLGIGKPAYVGQERFTLEEALAELLACGASPVWAHPEKTTKDPIAQFEMAEYMASLGLKGIECWCPSSLPDRARPLAQMAYRLGLAVTSGSAWPGDPDGMDLGDMCAYWTEPERGLPDLIRKIQNRERFL